MESRLSKIANFLKAESLAAFYLTNLPVIRYLTGFSGSNAAVLIFPNEVHFFTDGRYEFQVQRELFPIPHLHVHITRNIPQYLHEQALMKEGMHVGFDSTALTVAQFEDVKKRFRRIRWKGYRNPFAELVAQKEEKEIQAIRKAARIAQKVYEYVLSIVKPGMRELELAAEISYTARNFGSEGDAFDIIVASGPRSSFPHGRASTRKLRNGDVVTLDFGCIVNGFCSDITRTFVLGKAKDEMKKIYHVLYDAYCGAIDQLKSGVTGEFVDQIARQKITAAGYGEYFKHSLGHGIGIQVHEYPSLSPASKDVVIPENSVVTIEPGIYLPGKFGMRIEDDVLVTQKGARLLSKAPHSLVVV